MMIQVCKEAKENSHSYLLGTVIKNLVEFLWKMLQHLLLELFFF